MSRPPSLEPGAYNVCSGQTATVRDLIAMVSEAARIPVRHEVDPERMRPHDVPEVRGSAELLGLASGWKPEIPLARTVADALDAWRARAAHHRLNAFAGLWPPRKSSIAATRDTSFDPGRGSPVINGVHAVIFTKEAEALRAFFRDVLELSSVDAGGGWLIFALPPAELAAHPSEADLCRPRALSHVRRHHGDDNRARGQGRQVLRACQGRGVRPR